MEFKVTVSIELGPNTFALISGIMQRATTPQDTSAAPTAEKDKTEKAPKGGGAGKAPKVEPTKEDIKAERAFDEFTEEEQIEAIKAEVTKHTKRGKSGDIKALLTFVGAERVSNLQGDDIAAFMALVQRYGAGETVDALTSLD
jgi:hypothetical protein